MALDLSYDFFRVDKNIIPQKGRLLISEPFLPDKYFRRSVILITEHTDQGSVGFVLNKPLELTINEVFEDFPLIEAEISVGGPVATDSVHFLHTLGDIIPKSVNIIQNVSWGGDFEAVKKLIINGNITSENIRFFVGYSGWAPKQLDRELSENSWIVAELINEKMIFKSDKNIWKESLRKLGQKYKLWAEYPENPVMN
jgi:putative transcriptional regulator